MNCLEHSICISLAWICLFTKHSCVVFESQIKQTNNLILLKRVYRISFLYSSSVKMYGIVYLRTVMYAALEFMEFWIRMYIQLSHMPHFNTRGAFLNHLQEAKTTVKSRSLTTNSKFNAICCFNAAVLHPNSPRIDSGPAKWLFLYNFVQTL